MVCVDGVFDQHNCAQTRCDEGPQYFDADCSVGQSADISWNEGEIRDGEICTKSCFFGNANACYVRRRLNAMQASAKDTHTQ